MKPSFLSLSCLPTPKLPGVVRPSTCPRPQTAPDVQCASTESRPTPRWEKCGSGRPEPRFSAGPKGATAVVGAGKVAVGVDCEEVAEGAVARKRKPGDKVCSLRAQSTHYHTSNTQSRSLENEANAPKPERRICSPRNHPSCQFPVQLCERKNEEKEKQNEAMVNGCRVEG